MEELKERENSEPPIQIKEEKNEPEYDTLYVEDLLMRPLKSEDNNRDGSNQNAPLDFSCVPGSSNAGNQNAVFAVPLDPITQINKIVAQTLLRTVGSYNNGVNFSKPEVPFHMRPDAPLLQHHLNSIPIKENPASDLVSMNGKNDLVCPICSKAFDIKFVFDIHMRLHASLSLGETSDKANFDLGEAASNITPPDSATIGNHNSPFVCIICNKVFNKKFKLTLHMKLHSSEKPFECVDCGARFKTKSYLSKHMVSHSDFKRFQCPHCDKQCKRKVDLSHHMLTHGNIRPYECIVCKRTFKSKAYLNQHLLMHTDPILFKQHADSYKAEGPLNCVVCQKLFINPAQLRNHLTTHSMIKPHQCPDCLMSFQNKVSLKNHLPCQNIGSLKCTICHASMKNVEELNEHFLLCHSGDKSQDLSDCQDQEMPQIEDFANNQDVSQNEGFSKNQAVPQDQDFLKYEDVPQHRDFPKNEDVPQHQDFPKNEDVPQDQDSPKNEHVSQHQDFIKREHVSQDQDFPNLQYS